MSRDLLTREITMAYGEYFKELNKMKENGTLFPFEQITFEQLEKLWWYESVSDKQISNLFNIPAHKVMTKRNKWDMKTAKYENKLLFDNLHSAMKDNFEIFADDFSNKILTEKGIDIKNDLNTELEKFLNKIFS